MKKVFIIFFALIFLHSGFSQENKKALLFTTTDYAIQDQWYKTIADDVPRMSQANKVVKGQKYILILMLLDYGLENNKAHVTYDLKITAPNGSNYLNEKNLLAVESEIKQKMLLMSKTLLFAFFDPPDNFGIYTIDVTVHDLVLNEDYDISTSITLLEEMKAEEFDSNSKFSEWIMTYHQKPSPERLITAVRFFVSSMMKKDEENYAAYGFFISAFRDNLYLLDEIKRDFNIYSEKEQFFLMYFLFNVKEKAANEFLESLKGTQAKYLQMMKDNNMHPTITDPIEHAAQLDFLWGSFFASGRYEHILQLVNALDLEDSNSAVYKAALWSINSNCEQNRLVLNYCRYMYQFEKLSDTVKNNVGAILKNNSK